MSKIESYTEVIAHTHSRVGDIFGQQALLSEVGHDSSFTIDGLIATVNNLRHGAPYVLYDTDHPVHALDRYGIDRKTAYSRILTDPRIRMIIDHGVIERALMMKNLGDNINTGVEVDILNPEGELDVSDGVLMKLDYVVASLHWSYWKLASGLQPDQAGYVRSLINVAQNHNVDAIGHPARELIANGMEDSRGFEEVFSAMSDNNTAYEINIAFLLEHGLMEYERELIRLARNHRVPFVFGMDFHNLNILSQSFPEDEPIDIESVKEIILRIKKRDLRYFTRKFYKLLIDLNDLGVNESNVANSSREKFKDWLLSR